MGVDLSLFNAHIGKVQNTVSDYKSDLALKVLEVMYLNTNFLGLEEAIDLGFKRRNTVMKYVSDMSCSIPKFNDMFRSLYNILFHLDLGQDCLRYPYPLYICGIRKNTYRIIGYDLYRESFVLPKGTVFDEIPTFYYNTPNHRSYINIIKSLGSPSTEEKIGLSKTAIIGTIYMESSDSNNIVEFESIFNKFMQKYLVLNSIHAKYGYDLQIPVYNERIDGRIYANKSDITSKECFYCVNCVCSATRNKLKEYMMSVLDLNKLMYKSKVEVGYAIISQALYELSYYNESDNICLTEHGRYRINYIRRYLDVETSK